MEIRIEKVMDKLLRLHKDICLLRENTRNREEFESVSVRAATVRECLHAIANCLEERQAIEFQRKIRARLDALAEGLYFQEILDGGE